MSKLRSKSNTTATLAIWHYLSDKQKAELQRRFPSMRPLGDVVLFETIEEIEAEMIKKPRGNWASYIGGKGSG